MRLEEKILGFLKEQGGFYRDEQGVMKSLAEVLGAHPAYLKLVVARLAREEKIVYGPWRPRRRVIEVYLGEESFPIPLSAAVGLLLRNRDGLDWLKENFPERVVVEVIHRCQEVDPDFVYQPEVKQFLEDLLFERLTTPRKSTRAA